MKLQPNIGSDRSWVWKVAADYSESPPTSETLAIRFANAESEPDLLSSPFVYRVTDSRVTDAQQFKEKFEEAQKHNVNLAPAPEPEAEAEKEAEAPEEPKEEESKEESTEEPKEEEKTE